MLTIGMALVKMVPWHEVGAEGLDSRITVYSNPSSVTAEPLPSHPWVSLLKCEVGRNVPTLQVILKIK